MFDCKLSFCKRRSLLNTPTYGGGFFKSPWYPPACTVQVLTDANTSTRSSIDQKQNAILIQANFTTTNNFNPGEKRLKVP
jgi:hypothetical protein